MPNPQGGNQFGNYTLQPAYGDVARQTQLTKESPISGSPFAAHALETPRRSQKQASRPASGQEAQAPEQAPQPGSGAPVAPQFLSARIWASIAQIPGASPLVQKMAVDAAQQSG